MSSDAEHEEIDIDHDVIGCWTYRWQLSLVGLGSLYREALCMWVILDAPVSCPLLFASF